MNVVVTQPLQAAHPLDETLAADVAAGLSATQKTLPCRLLYDAAGSALFERITALPEYYPTRTEAMILAQYADAIVADAPDGAVMIEFGSGSSRKTEILLDRLPGLAAYAPLDVSPSALEDARQRLAARYPRLRVEPIVGDFASHVVLPADLAARPRIGFFPGSTIGNLTRADAGVLLAHMGETLGQGGRLIIGVDLKKHLGRLLPAYDDAEGVTAAFNLNLLHRLNRDLDADFDVAAFRHEARFNEQEGRIEMHLVSRCAQSANVLGRRFDFALGESIHTENSYKYAIPEFTALARAAGFSAAGAWVDPDALFSVHALVYDANAALP